MNLLDTLTTGLSLAEQIDVLQNTQYDIQTRIHDLAKARIAELLPTVQRIEFEWRNDSFDDGTTETVISGLVLHHLDGSALTLPSPGDINENEWFEELVDEDDAPDTPEAKAYLDAVAALGIQDFEVIEELALAYLASEAAITVDELQEVLERIDAWAEHAGIGVHELVLRPEDPTRR